MITVAVLLVQVMVVAQVVVNEQTFDQVRGWVVVEIVRKVAEPQGLERMECC